MTFVNDPMHDEINLIRLVRRLERDTPEQPENEVSPETWIKAQGMLQKVKFARGLLKNVESHDNDDEDQSPQVTNSTTYPHRKRAQRLDDIRTKLSKIESHFKLVEKPEPTRPPSILSSIPRPAPVPAPLDLPSSPQEPPPVPTDSLLLPADDPSTSTSFSFPTPMTLIPTTPPPASVPTAVTTGVAPRFNGFLQSSSAIQEELLEQVAHMASQLKRNTVHFSELLRRDQGVVDDAKEKLERNFDVMQKERVRLRDHRGKSWGTTWLSVLVVLAVLVLFVMMVGIIRLT